MFFLFEKLCKEIGDEKEIIIYGAGYFSKQIYQKFCEIGWNNRIKCFAVTAIGSQPDNINSIPVVKFEDGLLYNDGISLLVAVGDAHIQGIRDRLSTLPPEQIFYLWDYRGYTDVSVKALSDTSFSDICWLALNEYIWNTPLPQNNRKELLDELEAVVREHSNKQVLDKSIVYVLEEETARDIKIIKALLEKGYKITVLQYNRKTQYVAKKELENLNVDCNGFDCMWDFMLKSLKYKPMLYFFDTETTFEFAFIAICHRDIWGKTVIAPYETLKGSFIGMKEEVFEFEKYCLENADAVVWRYFSKEYLQDKMGYQFKGDSIQLLDNCGGYEIPHQSSEPQDEKVKLCCVVSQIDSFLWHDSSTFTRQARFGDLLDKLDLSCELHVFAWSASVEAERELKKLVQEHKNFKYFLGVEHNDLIRRMSAYDYGLCVYTSERIPEYPLGAEVIWGGYVCTEGTYRYSVANRYFDYIDAELAVITTLPEKLCEYLQKFDVIVKMNLSNLNPSYLKTKRKYYRKRAKAAKHELLMSKQIDSLTNLFEKICSNGYYIERKEG